MEVAVQHKPNWKKRFGITSLAAGITAIATSSFAVETLADLMAVPDISGAKTAVYTFLSGLILIGVLFFGRRLLAKMGVSL